MISRSINKELLLAKKLNEEGKYEDALQIISVLEKRGDLSQFEHLSCKITKGTIMIMVGQYSEVLKFVEGIIQRCQELGKKLLLVDAFILKSRALYWLRKLDEMLDILEQSDILLKTLTDVSSNEIKKRKAWISWGKGLIYKDKQEPDLQIKYLEDGLKLGEDTKNSEIKFKCNMLIGYYYTYQGDYELALLHINRSLEIAKEMQNHIIIAWSFSNLAIINYDKGELDDCIKNLKKALKLYRQTNNKLHFSHSLNILSYVYIEKGDFNRASKYLKRCLIFFEEIGDVNNISDSLHGLIFTSIQMGDYKQTHLYFNRLKQINKKEKNQKFVDIIYRFSKALMLKEVPHLFNLSRSKLILEKIINEENIAFGFYITAILELCHLYLIELKDTNDLKLLDTIQLFIKKLNESAKKIHSYWLLAEIQLIQAKLELITLDLNEAQHSLIKAHEIADKYGLNLLDSRILYQQDELKKELAKWEKLKHSKSFISERIELAGVEEQLILMLRKRISLDKIYF
ncbi:MAG: tetratricopeptide repeat protein [Candidatus Thorarchaeota archaeon]